MQGKYKFPIVLHGVKNMEDIHLHFIGKTKIKTPVNCTASHL